VPIIDCDAIPALVEHLMEHLSLAREYFRVARRQMASRNEPYAVIILDKRS
jgi:hypothetical protein